jgi:hypothetical protein
MAQPLFGSGPWGPPFTIEDQATLAPLIDDLIAESNSWQWAESFATYAAGLSKYFSQGVDPAVIFKAVTKRPAAEALRQQLAQLRPDRKRASGDTYQQLRWRSTLPEEQHIECRDGFAVVRNGCVDVSHLLLTPEQSLQQLEAQG